MLFLNSQKDILPAKASLKNKSNYWLTSGIDTFHLRKHRYKAVESDVLGSGLKNEIINKSSGGDILCSLKYANNKVRG